MSETRLLALSQDKATHVVLGRLCRRRGFELVAGKSGSQLESLLAEGGVSLVVLDLDGDDVDGLEQLRTLAHSRLDAPVILASNCDARTLGVAQRVGIHRGLTMGPPLAKPLEENRTMRSILEALRMDDPTITPAAIRKAIDDDELRLNYQPLVDLRTGTVRSVEALLRWQHPEYGALSPQLVVALAEANDLVGPLTQWVTRTALEQLREWQAAGWGFRVGVNVSAPLLLEPSFAEDIATVVKDADVPPQSLVLEITESQALTERIEVLETLTRLRLAGMALAIDDFGTGFSSLGRLISMPFSELKIDRSFVEDAPGDSQGEMIVRAITDLGHNLDMTVVAEGVSTREVWDLVSDVGCDVAQGFFISRALRAEQFTQWLQRWDVPTSVAPRLPVRAPAAPAEPAENKRKKAPSSRKSAARRRG